MSLKQLQFQEESIREGQRPRPGKDFTGIGVAAIVPDGAGRYLLIQRGPECSYDAGKWEFPGGKLERMELLSAAVERETVEETGLRVWVEESLGMEEYLHPETDHHWLGFRYLCRRVEPLQEPRVMEPGKCLGVCWCSPARIDQMLAAGELSRWTALDWQTVRRRFL